MPRLLFTLLVALVALGGLLGAAATAGAQTSGPCIPGTAAPVCQLWIGGVTFVADGDTIDVDLADDGTASPVRIRLTGIQAMEQSVYSHNPAKRVGECHALEATTRLEQLIHDSGGVVRLAAQDPTSHSGRRERRSVQVLIADQWVDVGRILLSEGLVLWLPNRREWAWNRSYNTLAQQAARAGIGLWNTEYCGGGPPAAVRLWVHWNAEGSDAAHPEDEWVRIRNLDATAPLALGGWWLRDSGLRRFTFPPGTVLAPSATLTVRVGAATGADLGWNLGAPIFANVRDGERSEGDGAYLFDPQGDLRAWMAYPCREACTDPNQGAIALRVTPSGREAIALRNTSEAPVDLEGYAVTAAGHDYTFARDATIAPDETLRLRVEGSARDDTRLEKHWGRTDPLLRNAGGAVRLSTFDGIVLACGSWGDGSC